MSDDLIELLRDPVVCYLATDARFRLANEIERNRAAIDELVKALEIAEAFVDRHSEPWYMSGQQDLTVIRTALAKHQTTTKE